MLNSIASLPYVAPGGDALSFLPGAAASSSPGVEGLEAVGRSNDDEVSYLESALVPQGSSYDQFGLPTDAGTGSAGGADPTTQLEQAMEQILAGDSSANESRTGASELFAASSSGASPDVQLLDDALPASPYLDEATQFASGVPLSQLDLYG